MGEGREGWRRVVGVEWSDMRVGYVSDAEVRLNVSLFYIKVR
jgi:hypothetical protein